MTIYHRSLFCIFLSFSFFLKILAEPLLQLAVTIGLLSLPYSITPTLLVWVYDKVLWVSEPIWLTVEAVGVVYIIVNISRKLVQRMDENPGTSKVNLYFVSLEIVKMSVHHTNITTLQYVCHGHNFSLKSLFFCLLFLRIVF